MGDGNFKIWSDIFKNRLYMILYGYLDDKKAKKAADACLSEIKRLKNGFAVISDIYEAKPGSPKASEYIEKTELFLMESGVSYIMRVVGDSGISNIQLNRKDRVLSFKYQEEFVTSFEEAENFLDSIRLDLIRKN